MAKHRIKKHNYINEYSDFEVQKKYWFFPFWYNFNNIDACTTGFYDSIGEAKKAIEVDRFKVSSNIIQVK